MFGADTEDLADLSIASVSRPPIGKRSMGPWRSCGLDVVDCGDGKNSLDFAR